MLFELRRILCNRIVLLLLVFVLMLNMVMFFYEQEKADYGFSDYNNNAFVLIYGDVDASAYLTSYTDRIETVREDSIENAVYELSSLSSLLNQAGTVIMLWKNTDSDDWNNGELEDYYVLYQRFLELYPDMEDQLENNETEFRVQVYIDSVAVNKLLAQLSYLEGYNDYLESIQNSAEQMLRFSIFNSGFTERSILKTVADFAKLDGVEVSLENTLPIEAFLCNRYIDYFLLVLVFLVVIQLLQERKTNMWPIVHAAKYGRIRLAKHRFVVVAVCVLIFVVLLYGSTLLESMLLYRGSWSVFSSTAQSVELLKQLTISCTLFGLFLRLFLFRLLTAYVIAIVLWLLFSIIPQGKLLYIGIAVILVVEYTFYTFLPSNSAWNILKYGNLFCMIFSTETYLTYLNLNFFDHPIGVNSIGVALTSVLGILSFMACMWLQWRKRPYDEKRRRKRFEEFLRKCSNAICARLGCLGFEFYQSLILRHGWLVFALFFIYCTQAQYSVSLPNTELNSYYASLEGPVGYETYQALETLWEENSRDVLYADMLQEQWDSGELTFQEYFSGMAQYGGAYATSELLAQVHQYVDELMQHSTDQTLWILDSTSFDSIYGESTSKLHTTKAIVLLLAMCLLFSGTLASEKQHKMLPVARATVRGRGHFIATQYAVLVTEVFFLCGIQSFFECRELVQAEIQYLSAPVQSISWLIDFPLPVSVAGFVVVRCIYRFFACTCIGCMLLWISSFSDDVRGAEVCALLVVVVPSILALYFELSILRIIAGALPVIGLSCLWYNNGEIGVAILVSLILLTIAIATVLWNVQRRRKSWS